MQGKKPIITLIAFIASLLSSCSYNENDIDPYEGFNREVFSFNKEVDNYITKPIALTYDFIVPDSIEYRISNVFSNLGEVTTVGNDILQLNAIQAVSDTWRFAINSTFGVLGIFDVASELDLPKNQQYFGKTLAFWGFDKSPYLVLPIIGPSTIYDSISLPVDNLLISAWPYLEPRSTVHELRALSIINRRSEALAYGEAVDHAFDPYIFVRNAYLQNREKFNEDNIGEHD